MPQPRRHRPTQTVPRRARTPEVPFDGPGPGSGVLPQDAELQALYHRLNNQLGVILAHAEVLETRAVDHVNRATAAKIVAGTLDAMATARQIRHKVESPPV